MQKQKAHMIVSLSTGGSGGGRTHDQRIKSFPIVI
jgi:hypothetical protein